MPQLIDKDWMRPNLGSIKVTDPGWPGDGNEKLGKECVSKCVDTSEQ